MPVSLQKTLPKIAFLYMDHVLRFFDQSNFKGWPDKIDSVTFKLICDKDLLAARIDRLTQDSYNPTCLNATAGKPCYYSS